MNLPQRVTIELTNKCNRRCDMCPRLKMTYPLGDMKLSLLKKIVDQLPSNTDIVPFFRGESVLYSDFVEAMNLLRRFDTLQIATNGDGLTEEKKLAILNTKSFISYSLHEFGYPLEFLDVARFLKSASENGHITQVSILNTMFSHYKEEFFIDSWLEYVDRVRIYIEHSIKGFGDIDPIYRRIRKTKSCKKVFEDMVIYWDGKVVLCNHDWDNYDPLGDLNYQTIEEVWNGEKYRKIRDVHKSSNIREVKSCKDCDHWMVDYLPEKMLGELYIR